MPDAYDLHEGRLVQLRNTNSVANALLVESAVVPAGKIWTVLLGLYVPSVAETQVVWWSCVAPGGILFPVSVPASIALSNAIPLPLVTEGMEIKLWPGDKLRVDRTIATAGSFMTIYYRFIETDLPYYSYVEPLKKIVNRVQKHSSINRAGGISIGGMSDGGGGRTGGGRDSSSEPI